MIPMYKFTLVFRSDNTIYEQLMYIAVLCENVSTNAAMRLTVNNTVKYFLKKGDS
jgi:hypothetical protein